MTAVYDRLRKKPRPSTPPSFPAPPPLFPDSGADPWADAAPAVEAPPARHIADHTAEPAATADTFERTLASGRAAGGAFGVYAIAASGNRVWVVPSRVSFTPDRYYVAVSPDEPPYTPLEGRELERLDGIVAVRSRLARGALDPDATLWRVHVER